MVRKIFLTEVDEETRADNEKLIKEWEQGLIHNEAFKDWQDHDVSREIADQARRSYIDCALSLASNRQLTDEQRKSTWAKQDAALWLLSLIDKDAKGTIKRIEEEIKRVLTPQTYA